jgi:GT2 family glycosyltransferase
VGWAARTRERVVIGTPRGGSVHSVFASSLDALIVDQYRNRASSDVQLAAVIDRSGLYIEDNRDWIAHRFLQDQTAPWLLMLDSDIQFAPDLIDQMLDAAHSVGAKVLSGNVPLDVYPTVAFYSTPQPGVFAPLKMLPPEKVFQADAVGTAIMLIHREVLQTIREREGECYFLRHTVEVEDTGGHPYRLWMKLGEDISFCLRARDAGFPSWVVQGLTGVTHHNLAATRRQLAEAEAELARLRGQAKETAA